MNSYLKTKGYEQIIILSSPYIRALQTASYVAKACGVEEITLNYYLGEALYTYLHASDPLPLIHVNTKSKDFIEKEYM